MSCMLHLTTIENKTYELLKELSAIKIISSQFALAGHFSCIADRAQEIH